VPARTVETRGLAFAALATTELHGREYEPSRD
jgi:hypothetical protein